jgi:hypothetical protein
VSEFINTLMDLHDGDAVRQLDKALAAVVQAGQITGKAGSVTLKLTVNPLDNDRDGVTVNFQVNSKEPRLEPKAVFFFIDDDGRLTRQAPIVQKSLVPDHE